MSRSSFLVVLFVVACASGGGAQGGTSSPGAPSAGAVVGPSASEADPTAPPAPPDRGEGGGQMPRTGLGPVAPFSGWCRHGGAALVGQPVLGEGGRLYLVTADGYLHAFEADGRFRFSYTVSGTPLGSPSLRPTDGAVLLGTTRRLIYAVNQRGGLYFQARTVAPVWSGLYPLDETSVVYLGLDRRVYALSNYGGALYRVMLPAAPVGEPVIGEDGIVWIPLENGVARLHRALSLVRISVPSPIEQLVALGRGAIVISRGQARWLDGHGGGQELGPARFAFGDRQRAVIVRPGGEIRQLSPDGTVREVSASAEARKLAGVAVSAGALWGDVAVVPLPGGQLMLLDMGESVRERVVDSGLGEVAGVVAGHEELAAYSPAGRVCLTRRD